jgi:hypothetical protein
MVRLEGLGQLINLMTSGLEPATLWLEADLSCANLISDFVSNIMNSAYAFK